MELWQCLALMLFLFKWRRERNAGLVRVFCRHSTFFGQVKISKAEQCLGCKEEGKAKIETFVPRTTKLEEQKRFVFKKRFKVANLLLQHSSDNSNNSSDNNIEQHLLFRWRRIKLLCCVSRKPRVEQKRTNLKNSEWRGQLLDAWRKHCQTTTTKNLKPSELLHFVSNKERVFILTRMERKKIKTGFCRNSTNCKKTRS